MTDSRWTEPTSPTILTTDGGQAKTTEVVTRRAGNGKRVLIAFVAGAAVSAGSFGLGAMSTDTDSVGASAPVPTTVFPVDSIDPPVDTVPAPSGTDAVAVVASALGPSVVQVETDRGLGSGVVYGDGLILTNHHVIDGAGRIAVRTADGRTIDATLLGSDARNDVAVLDVGSEAGLPVARLALDDAPQVGQLAVAIGSPFQLQQTVTSGIVSAVNRPVPNAGGGYSAMIQTDASINPGNSGGALANRLGEVIGINASIRTDGTSDGNVGIGFAIPIETAVDVADRIVAGDSLEVGVLGVSNATSPDDQVGVVIGEVVSGGAADRAGLEPGDRLVTIDGAPVTSFEEVVGLVQSHFGGDTIALAVVRSGAEVTLTATLT